MKLGDKLILLRKKNGLSQEELAEKLGVSRQSVSKWESNNTYPETDKIVQICNLFDCSMDDLINDKVTDVEQTMRKNKNTLNEALDSFLEFVTKTVNMFYSMKFMSGLKCIIEMVIIAFLLHIGGNIICNIASRVFSNLFGFLGYEAVHGIDGFLNGAFHVLWFILAVIVLIHTFKIRYLNYYEKSISEKKEEVEEENPKKEKIEFIDKEPKIVIRDPKDRSFTFLNLLSKIFIWIFKFILLWILMGVICAAVGFITSTVITMCLIPTNLIFLGITFMLLSASIFTSQILILGIFFIINKKAHAKLQVFLFLGAIILFGVGIAITAISAKNFTIIEDSSDVIHLTEESIQLEYQEDMILLKSGDGVVDYYHYVIDDSMENNQIIVSEKIDTRFQELAAYNYNVVNEYQMKKYHVSSYFNGNVKGVLDLIIKDLKKNQIHVQYTEYDMEDGLFIKANRETIQKLLENVKTLYLVEEIPEENGYVIVIKDDRVYFPNGFSGFYNAKEDTLQIDDLPDYKCIRSITETEWGDKIIYNCSYREEEYDE